ncbi:hypothetical protein PVAND_010651 [Polypedilum vanderplanki]|uniref:Uncharacterized protein n=1 Tax=Polypedilum vanderplanki TaxID=319348 RepID=A0A9J6CG94_POLVA|nr:hypothetical protein PVAND_010651 [Polypedilum vanderplanki]
MTKDASVLLKHSFAVDDCKKEREIKRKWPISGKQDDFDLNSKLIKLENEQVEKDEPNMDDKASVNVTHNPSSNVFSTSTQEQITMEESPIIVNSQTVEFTISNAQYANITNLINLLHQKVDNLINEVNVLKSQLTLNREESVQDEYSGQVTSKED